MKTIMLLIVLAVASLQVNAQKNELNKSAKKSQTSVEKKPLLECEDSFTKWLNKANGFNNQLIQPFEPLTSLLVPVKNVSRDLSPAIKIVSLNTKENE